MQSPDFRTISKFRARHLEALGKLFNQVLNLCREAGLVSLGHVALDGTKLKGNASLGKNKMYSKIKEEERRLKEEIKAWLKHASEVDEEEDKEFGEDKRGDELPEWFLDKAERVKRLKEAREKLKKKDQEAKAKRAKEEKEGKKGRDARKKTDIHVEKARYNFTDPDSTVQRTRGGAIQGYNAQAAVDSKAHIIVAHNVTSESHDSDQLVLMVERIEENMRRKPEELSCDAGYCTEGNLKALEEMNIRGYVAVGNNPAKRKRAIKKGTRKGAKRTRYRLRKTLVEPIFGLIKTARGFQQFLLRGKDKVSEEFALLCTAHNLLRLIKLRA
jgi:hypothetical protein